MGLKQYNRHSAPCQRSTRWPALRLAAKRRDGWRCVQCGARGRLEVDHVKPVRAHPELAFRPRQSANALRRAVTRGKPRSKSASRRTRSPSAKRWRDLSERKENLQCLNP